MVSRLLAVRRIRPTYFVCGFPIAAVTAVTARTMVAMTVPSVHEQVHQRAEQEDKVGEKGENVPPVFCQEEIGDGADQAQCGYTFR